MIAAGIVYAFMESTFEGKAILTALFLASIFSWSVMVTKFRYLSFCKRQNERFYDIFHEDRQPLRIYEKTFISRVRIFTTSTKRERPS